MRCLWSVEYRDKIILAAEHNVNLEWRDIIKYLFILWIQDTSETPIFSEFSDITDDSLIILIIDVS